MTDRPDPLGFAPDTAADPLAPPVAPLDMPVQALARPPGAACPWPRPALSSSTRCWRGIAVLVPLATAAFAATLSTAPGFGAAGWAGLQPAVLAALVFACTGWLAWGAMVALIGHAAPPPAPPAPPRGRARAVIAIPVHHEDPRALARRILRMRSSLREAGQEGRFDFAVLSDTGDPAMAATERAALMPLAGGGRLFYRCRADNAGRKAGNIADFLRRSGAAWDFVVVLDADSLMSGATLAGMVDRIEADPGLALIQTLPRIAGAETVFARAQAFAATLYGPVHARGVARLQGNEGPFWGHNAVFRTRAFAAACGLPRLPGRPPFGGAILSHDTVEAAFLARAGWRVRFDPDLGGSWEETPATLIHHARRDRRWAQGNLQHLGVIGAAGLPGWSRAQIAQGIMAYLASPLWLLLLVVAAADGRGGAAPTGSLAALTVLLLLGPRAVVAGAALWRGDCREWGGRRAFLRSVVAELLLSALVAPVMMVLQTRAVLGVLAGRDGGWPPQCRSGGRTGWGQALAATRPAVVAGAGALAAGAVAPALFPWVLPVALPLILAPCLAVWLSRPLRGSLFACPAADPAAKPSACRPPAGPPCPQPRASFARSQSPIIPRSRSPEKLG